MKLIKVLTTIVIVVAILYVVAADVNHGHGPATQIGRASCRERV